MKSHRNSLRFVLGVLGMGLLISCGKSELESSSSLRPPLQFSCLRTEDVSFDKETGTVSLTWQPVRGPQGSVVYTVYDGNIYPEPLQTTVDSTWTFKVSPDQIRIFVFSVEAKDEYGETHCKEGAKFVLLKINSK
jgi:hypothetical protein